MGDDEAFLRAVTAAPQDELPRLAYADWLDDRGDPRGPYLRAEIEHFRGEQSNVPESPVWPLREAVDPVWAARVSRPPFGVLVPGLTYSDRGPAVGPADLQAIEDRWGAPLPPDYAAFLLSFNGGRPSRPCLYSYAKNMDGDAPPYHEWHDEVRFFSTADRDTAGRPYLQLSLADVYAGRLSEEADEERLAQLMPIGSVDRDDGEAEGSEGMLALCVPDDDYPKVTVVLFFPHSGEFEEDDAHGSDMFLSILTELQGRPEAGPDEDGP